MPCLPFTLWSALSLCLSLSFPFSSPLGRSSVLRGCIAMPFPSPILGKLRHPLPPSHLSFPYFPGFAVLPSRVDDDLGPRTNYLVSLVPNLSNQSRQVWGRKPEAEDLFLSPSPLRVSALVINRQITRPTDQLATVVKASNQRPSPARLRLGLNNGPLSTSPPRVH